MIAAEAEIKIPCKFCVHDYDSHNPDAADEQRNMPCTECPDGICRYRGAVSENPAETIRRAAALMRERAQAATPGPWRPVAGIWMAETFAAVIGSEGVAEDAETWLMATGRGAASQEADADHAASWHPVPALAVARWLESLDGIEFSEYGPMTNELTHALAIARDYLGETEAGHG